MDIELVVLLDEVHKVLSRVGIAIAEQMLAQSSTSTMLSLGINLRERMPSPQAMPSQDPGTSEQSIWNWSKVDTKDPVYDEHTLYHALK